MIGLGLDDDFWESAVPEWVRGEIPRSWVPTPKSLHLIDHSPQGVREWITKACQDLSVNTTTLSKIAGLAPSTINRFISGKSKALNLNATSIERINLAIGELNRANLRIYGSEQLGIPAEKLTKTTRLRVNGIINNGVWDSVGFTKLSEPYQIEIPTASHMGGLCISLFEIGNNHATPVYPEGSVLICVFTPRDRMYKWRSFYKEDIQNTERDEFLILRRKNGKLQSTIRKVIYDPKDAGWAMGIADEVSDEEILYLGKEDHRFSSDFIIIGRVMAAYRAPWRGE